MLAVGGAMGIGTHGFAADEEPTPKEVQLRRNIERALGRNPKGHFLIALREVTSGPNQPVNFTASVIVCEGREEATDKVFDYLRDDSSGNRGFRLVERFDATAIGKDLADAFCAEFQTLISTLKLPAGLQVTQSVGKLGSPEFQEVTTGPRGAAITLARSFPKAKRTVKLSLTLP